MKRQFPSLSEVPITALKGTLEGLLPSVNVGVFFKILGKRKIFETDHTDVLLAIDMRVLVPHN